MSIGDPKLIEAINKGGIVANRESNKIYTAEFGNSKGRYVSVYISERNGENEDIKISVSPKIELRFTFIFDKDNINGVELTRYKKDGPLYKADGVIKLGTITFEQILGMLHMLSQLDLKAVSTGSLILDESIVSDPKELAKQLKTLIADEEGRKVLATIVSSDEKIQDKDLRNIANKKAQLKVFRRFMEERDYFNSVKVVKELRRDEDLWQRFFENNKWIFGYGLELVFCGPVGKKLEQTTVGKSIIHGSGKRPDALLKTLGAISNVLFGEIKLPDSPLIEKDPSHPEVYYPSKQLVAAVAQVQKTIHKTLSISSSDKIDGKNQDGYLDPTNDVYLIQPRGVVITGSLAQFKDESGSINEDMYTAFQLYRNNLNNPQIITYDELLARVENIIENVEHENAQENLSKFEQK
jgi:hypothetical protein